MEKPTFKFSNEDNYNCEIILDNGEKYLIYANTLHNNNFDNWKNWKCDVGVNRIYVTENFDVYSGECKNNHLGNLFQGYKLLDDNVCQRDRCNGCTDDLMAKKSKR